MKLTKLNIYKQLIPFSLFSIISLFVWFDGPLISINGYRPLSDIEKRVDIIGLFFLCWLLKVLFFDTHSKKKINDEPISPDIKKKLDYLKGRFQGAVKFLKSTVIHKNGKNINLVRLPWYLVLGPAGSGKTTLLANSDIKYILAKQFKAGNIKAIPPSDMCNWWVTRDLVLVDVPGSYLISKTKNMPQGMAAFPFLWQQLLKLLSRIRLENKLQGVIVTLHLPELMKQTQSQKKNEVIVELKKRLMEVLETFGSSMPIHLVITKCDMLPGFMEFFGESSSDEAAQAWGVTLPLDNENENLLTLFVQRFNALIKRLNKQLIWHLHQERNDTMRSYIKDFPLQIERLKESIVQVLKALSIPNLPLFSIYLTSSTQNNIEEPTTALLSSAEAYFTSQPAGIIAIPEMPPRAYFIRQFILHNLLAMPARPDVILKQTTLWQHRAVYGTAVSAVLLAAIFLGYDFERSVQQAYSVKKDLALYQQNMLQSKTEDERLRDALPLLNSLRAAANADSDKFTLAFYDKKSKKTASIAYDQALQNFLLPEIKNSFEKYLQMTNNKNQEQVYKILKAYLMLEDASHFQANSMTEVLQQLIPDLNDKTIVASLTDHIQAAVGVGGLITLDHELIAKVRKQLLEQSNEALSFVILKNMGNNNKDDAIDLGTLLGTPPVLVSKGVATVIPAMFTAKKFNSIVTNEIYAAASETLQGNWILGTNAVVDQMSVDTLASQLRTQYIANYVDIWESLLANIQLSTPENLKQLDTMVVVLTGNKSPLLQLLDTIKINTALSPITAASPKLQTLSLLLSGANNAHPNALYEIFVSLQELHSYFQTMLSEPDTSISISQAVAKHMKNPSEDPITRIHSIAEQSPEPMKGWLNTIATKSWDFMLQETQTT